MSRVLAKPSRVRELLFELAPAPIANSSTNHLRLSPRKRGRHFESVTRKLEVWETIGRIPESVTRCAVVSVDAHRLQRDSPNLARLKRLIKWSRICHGSSCINKGEEYFTRRLQLPKEI